MADSGGRRGGGGFTPQPQIGAPDPGVPSWASQVIPTPGATPGATPGGGGLPGQGQVPQGIPTWVDQATQMQMGMPVQGGGYQPPSQMGIPVQQGAPMSPAPQVIPAPGLTGDISGGGIPQWDGGQVTSQQGGEASQGGAQYQQGIPTWIDQAVKMQMGIPVQQGKPRPVGAPVQQGKPMPQGAPVGRGMPPPTVRKRARPKPKPLGAPVEESEYDGTASY